MLSNVTLRHLIEWTNAQVVGHYNPETLITSLISDSRELKSGEVFIALKGEKFDGHLFLSEAAQKGAIALISEVDPPSEIKGKIPVLKVANSLKAYVAVGRAIRKRFQGKVFAITGSAGKSSTKDMTGALLAENTIISPKSFNNLLGVSKTLCLLEDETQNLILEMGMNNLGEIKEICENFEPLGGVITNIGDAHIGKLGGREGIYQAKKELFDWVSTLPDALGIAVNLDDEWIVKAWRESFKQKKIRTITFSSKDSKSDVFISQKKINPQTGFLTVELISQEGKLEVTLPHFGMHHAYNLAAAVSLARLANVSWSEIKNRLSKVIPSRSRGELINLKNSVTLIDESYNSNPSALISSLESLVCLEPKKRKILVLGEMRELENFTQSLHEEVGEKLGKMIEENQTEGVAFVVGKQAKGIVTGLNKIAPRFLTNWVESVDQVIPLVQNQIQAGDIIFIKGSRGIELDKLVQKLK